MVTECGEPKTKSFARLVPGEEQGDELEESTLNPLAKLEFG